jgi:hypothetical protein
MADGVVVASQLIPELQVVSRGTRQLLLPDAAEGEVEVWTGNDGFEAYGYTAGGLHWARFPGTASFCFDAERSTVVAIPDNGASALLVEDVYRRSVLPLVIQLRGHEVLHASAVDRGDGLVVFCGVSGAGKSTFAYALSRRGYRVWADDAVALDIDESCVTAFRVPFQLALRPDVAGFLGRPLAIAETEAATPSPLVAVVVLEPVDDPDAHAVRLSLLDPSAAFTAVLPHAYCFQLSNLDRKRLMVDRYLLLASSVLALGVRYRRGLDHLSLVLDEIEAKLPA